VNRRYTPPRHAFTLIELVAVVIVLAVLGGVAVPKYFDHTARAKTAATQGVLGAIRSALAAYYQNSAVTGTPRYPSATDLATAGVVIQGDVPRNPYNNSNAIHAFPAASAALARTVDGTQGWSYFVDNTTNPPTATFWCNSSTATTLTVTYTSTPVSGGSPAPLCPRTSPLLPTTCNRSAIAHLPPVMRDRP
jgi:prepilin-type N-terminal cleavage/methylation domain-containing protein